MHIQPLEPRRLLNAADLDPTFGQSPIQLGAQTYAGDIAAASDGSLFVVARVAVDDSTLSLRVVHFDATGHPITTYGTGGAATVGDVSSVDGGPTSLIDVDAQGRALVTANGTVYRFTAAGSLDNTFSGDGKLPIGETIYSVQVDSSNRVLLAAAQKLYRFTTAGNADTTFDGDGVRDFSAGSNPASIGSGLAVRGGAIAVALAYQDGSASSNTPHTEAVYKLTANGAFDGDALFTQSFYDATFTALGIAADGTVVAGGTDDPILLVQGAGGSQPAFQFGGDPRYNFFDGDFMPANPFGTPRNILFSGNRTIIYDDQNFSGGQRLIALDATGKLDLSFSSDGQVLGIDDTFGSIGGITTPPDGSIVYAVNAQTPANGIGITLRRLLPNGDPTPPPTVVDRRLIVTGTAGNDTLTAGDGNGGDITFNGNALSVDPTLFNRISINGGDGRDTITVTGHKRVRVNGGPGSDRFIVNTRKTSVYLFGGGGNDIATTGGSRTAVTFNAAGGDDTLVSGYSDDTFLGGAGRDTADYSQHFAAVAVSLDNIANDGLPSEADDIHADVEAAIGTAADDLLIGNENANTLRGLGGDDTLIGLGGADYLLGDAGSDRLFGNGGRDTLIGGTGKDRLYGGEENDRLYGARLTREPDGAADLLSGESGTGDYGYGESLDILESIERPTVTA